MKIKLAPRFFLISGVLVLGVILYGSNLLLKKRVEVKIVDTPTQGKVLAADTGAQGSGSRAQKGANSSYDLIGGDIGGAIGGDLGSPSDSGSSGGDIAHYQPVTIAYTVKEGDTLQSIAEKYHADAQTIADFPNNGLKDSLELHVGQILIIPNGYTDDSIKPPPPPIAHGTGQFAWPTIGGTITQYAYYWHPGAIDIGIPLTTPVTAADDGTVSYAGWDTTGYGNTVLITHGDGLTSRYAHLTEIKVTVGQGIHKRDLVGLSGSTGHSTGPHLHFEVRRNGAPVDPMTLLPPDPTQPAPNTPATLP